MPVTDMQERFLGVLFDVEVKGDIKKAAKMAGYNAPDKNAWRIARALKDEIIERTKEYLASHPTTPRSWSMNWPHAHLRRRVIVFCFPSSHVRAASSVVARPTFEICPPGHRVLCSASRRSRSWVIPL